MLTQDQLKQFVHYDPSTGIFTWRMRTPAMFSAGKYTAERQCKRFNASSAETVAGSLRDDGYIRLRIMNKAYYAHQLAALYMEGVLPPHEMDHINMVRDDNRWINLRHATRSQNKRNMRARADNTTGYKGVSQHKRSGKYVAAVGGRWLGEFACPELAALVASEFRATKHGVFARD